MKALHWTFALILVIAIAGPGTAEDKRRDEARKPLVLASQGSFFVGGESKSVGGGEITVNQMCTCSIRHR